MSNYKKEFNCLRFNDFLVDTFGQGSFARIANGIGVSTDSLWMWRNVDKEGKVHEPKANSWDKILAFFAKNNVIVTRDYFYDTVEANKESKPYVHGIAEYDPYTKPEKDNKDVLIASLREEILQKDTIIYDLKKQVDKWKTLYEKKDKAYKNIKWKLKASDNPEENQ